MADKTKACPGCGKDMKRIENGWQCENCGVVIKIHVKKKRLHDSGLAIVHVHQFGDSTMFGFDLYAGNEANTSLLTLSRGVEGTIEAAMAAADAVVHPGRECGEKCGKWEDAD